MKTLKIVFVSTLMIVLATACSTIRVTTDYETQTDFNQYKTFAFYKSGIDKAPISDIDKRRIIRAISQELEAKGMVKSKTPDIVIGIFTNAYEKVDVYERSMYPYSSYPFQRNYRPFSSQSIHKYTEGTLFINIIDSKIKKLVWQGIGKGFLTKSSKPEKRDANIQNFVREIMERYPPK